MTPSSDAPLTEAQLLPHLAKLVERVLPPGWTTQLDQEMPLRAGWHPDAVLRIIAPGGEGVSYLVEAKRSLNPTSVLGALSQLRKYMESNVDRQLLPLIFTTFVSPRSKDLLAEQEVSYLDTTGNSRLIAEHPGLYVYTTGALKDPWPDDQPLRSLKGRGAAKAVRALLDFRPPYGVRDLAKRSGASSPTLSRVIDLLARDAILTRDGKGGVVNLDWAGTIRRWSQDYELRRSNRVYPYLDPRGLGNVEQILREADWRYATTGSIAAQRYAPIARTRTVELYVGDAAAVAALLRLRPAETGANVLLVEPFDDVVFMRTQIRDGLVTVAPTQLAVDLLSGPGREPSEGEELLDWMRKNENTWRS